MKALSLWQPWASFIAIGVKPFETRDWKPPRGLLGQRIAIHAAKKAVNREDREWARRHGVPDLPLGAIVCTAVLAGAYQCGTNASRLTGSPDVPGGIFADEYGDYAPGRWAWWLTDIKRLDPPVPAIGRQGIWECAL